MYKITFPIPVFSADEKHVSLPTGLARDLLTHHKYQPELRIICPRHPGNQPMEDSVEISLDDYPGLSFRFLPWSGGLRSWPFRYLAVKAILIEEARDASVWHTVCGPYLWDVSTVSHAVGRRYAKETRIFCLDSDPVSLLERSGGWLAFRSGFVDAQIKRRVADADGTIFVGAGVQQRYSHLAKRSLPSQAFWLQEGDLAQEEEVRHKFEQSSGEPIRMIVPARFEPWKGIDDVIQALISLGDRISPWQLDVMGFGPYKEQLVSLARDHADKIRFVEPVHYGAPFFERLRSYHIVFVPTRGLEEQRVAYDSAASGCALIHSSTVTLETSLNGLEPRWSFEPGNVSHLADTIMTAVAERSRWSEAGLAGVAFMKGRTIDEMHRLRAEFVSSIKDSAGRNSNSQKVAQLQVAG
ncbi:MAG: glycosyltransferase [Cyanobacteriota bacterium]